MFIIMNTNVLFNFLTPEFNLLANTSDSSISVSKFSAVSANSI